MEDHIGTVLHFDERSYNDSLAAYNKVCKVINVAGKAYEDLDSTFVFNQEVFKDMMTYKSANIYKQYQAVIDAQIKSLNFTSKAVIDAMKAKIITDVQELEDKIEAVFKTIENIGQFQNPFVTIYFDLSNISIVDGNATIADEKKEKVKDLCLTKIRTEDQSTLYGMALKLQQDYEEFFSFIAEKNPKIIQNPYPSTFFHNHGGRFSETGKGELIINTNIIAGI